MAASDDKHNISLVIEAKNLSSDEIEAVAHDIDNLGKKAIQAEKALDNLKIDQDNLNTYNALGNELRELKQALAESEVEYEDLARAVKKNSNATKEERAALKLSYDALKQQRKEVRGTQTAYDNLRKKVRAKLQDDETLVQYQERITKSTRDTRKEIDKLNDEYSEGVADVRKQIKAQREFNEAMEATQAQVDAGIAAQKKQDEVDKKAAAAKSELIAKLNQYEQALKDLNQDRRAGIVADHEYIKAEADLREAVGLTSAQVRDSKRIVEAESKAVKQAAEQRTKAAQDAVEAAQRKEKALRDEVNAELDAAEASRKKAVAEKQANAATEASIREYEVSIQRLLRAKAKNQISTGDFIRQEEKLRKQLKLTETQVSATRRAVEADVDSRNRAARATDSLTTVTRRLAQAYTVLLAAQKSTQAITSGVKAYGELESAMIGVEKTTGDTRQEIEKLTEQLVGLSKDVTPTAAAELANMAQVAGQLGVSGSADIAKLVLTVDALENSTNLSGEAAATLLTRILNLSGEGVQSIDKLGSVFVELGNNFAVAEDEIAHMTQEIVTGTTAIDLGAASAAAFGAALKVSGQQAERSRSAMFRLSQAMKSARVNGGKELETLAKITGQTADEFKAAFDDDVAGSLLSVIQGFAKVRDEGGLLTETLSELGINGVESTAVLEALAKNVVTLEDMLGKANEQWVQGNALLDEAVKAYASQESAVGRLANTFRDLQVRIGEALSDETNQTIQDMTDLINDQGGAVVNIIEDFAGLYEGIKDVITGLDLMLEGIGGIGGVWDKVYNSMRAGLNAITMSLKTAVVGWKEIWLVFREALGASDEELAGIRESIKALRNSANQDFQDITDAVDDFHGKSSDAYRDLKKASEQYADQLGNLTAEEQARIKQLVEETGYSAELNGEYRKLTATLVALGREQEIRANLSAQQAEAEREAREEQEKAAAASAAFEKELAALNITSENITTSFEVLAQAHKDGIISTENYTRQTELLREAQRRLTETAKAGNAEQRVKTELAKEVTAAESELQQRLQEKQNKLAEVNAKLQENIDSETELVGLLLKKNNLEKEVAETERELQITTELMGKTVTELVQVQEQHEKKLAAVKQQYESGQITLKEYDAAMAQLATTTEILDDALSGIETKSQTVAATVAATTQATRTNTEATKENSDATAENSDNLDDAADSAGGMSSAAAALASVLNHLNTTFDYSNHSLEQLDDRLQYIQETMNHNARTISNMGGAWGRLNEQAWSHEQQSIQQEIALRDLTAAIDAGSLSIDEMAYQTKNASWNFDKLDDTRLDGLNDAVERATERVRDAQEEVRRFGEGVQDALQQAQDKLYELQGDREALLESQYDQQLSELELLAAQAKAYGDQEALRNAEKAIALTEKARGIARQDLQERIALEDQREREAAEREKQREAEAAEREKQRKQQQRERDEKQDREVQDVSNATVRRLEQKIAQLEAAAKSAGSHGTTIILQSGNRKAQVNGIVDEVLAVLQQAGLVS